MGRNCKDISFLALLSYLNPALSTQLHVHEVGQVTLLPQNFIKQFDEAEVAE